MAYTKRSAEAKEMKFFNIVGMEVRGVRVINDNTVAFSLHGNGISLFNLRLINGKNGEFISSPSNKVETDNGTEYYPQYNIYLSETDMDFLIEKVKERLNG